MTRMAIRTKGWTLHRPATIATALLLALAGCGGDGGGGGGVSEPVALTPANRDAVAHSTAANISVLGVSGAMQINAAGDDRRQALSAKAGWLPGSVFDAVQRALAAPARSGVARALAAATLPPEPCGIAGTITLSVDDRDNNGQLTVGDIIGMVFTGCQDDMSAVYDGQVTATMTRIDNETHFGMRVAMNHVSQRAVNGRHDMTIDGTVLADYAATPDFENLTITADGPVSAGVRTHLPYNDTVTLSDGFKQTSVYQTRTRQTLTNFSGRVSSVAAGGAFDVRTDARILGIDSEVYPASGIVLMTGSAGAMRLTVESTEEVVVELDAAADGIYEDRQRQTWDWLF